MEKIKHFWRGKSELERRKIIVYSVAGLFSFLLILGVVAWSGSDGETNVAEISNPDAVEAKKYNSRTEANQLGRKDTMSLNSALDHLFGDSRSEGSKDALSDISGGTYQESTYSEPVYSVQPSSAARSGGNNYNSHSTYGDYSMWQGQEPKNNSIGYTEIRNYQAPKEETVSPLSDDQHPVKNNGYVQPFSSYPSEKRITDGKQVRAKLISHGYATPGRSLSFVLLEPAVINNVETAKGQIVTGVASENNGRLDVNFSTVKIKNKIIPAQLQLYGSDGMLGLPISGGISSDNTTSAVGNRARDMVGNQASRIPVLGGIIGGTISSSGSRSSDNRIKLSANVECTIVVF